MTKSADSDQLASSEANGSVSTLFAKTGHAVFSKKRLKTMFGTAKKWSYLWPGLNIKYRIIRNCLRLAKAALNPCPAE